MNEFQKEVIEFIGCNKDEYTVYLNAGVIEIKINNDKWIEIFTNGLINCWDFDTKYSQYNKKLLNISKEEARKIYRLRNFE